MQEMFKLLGQIFLKYNLRNWYITDIFKDGFVKYMHIIRHHIYSSKYDRLIKIGGFFLEEQTFS